MRLLTHRARATSVSLLAVLLAGALAAQPAGPYHLDDPANLAGERVSPQDPADTLSINHGAPALQQLLQKLRTRASFMLFVAHPDDEDGGLLTYLSRGQGARVAMLTLNRGEGGQNLMSADFDDALGLIRTQELLAADRYMGVDQFFGSVVDFGFSKTKEEAFAKWGHDRVLYDAVRAVRLYRPLVIASVFVGGPTDGHGQHQVAGEIAQEVFTAAADPKVFPEMGLPAWAPLKVYARTPFSRVDERGMYDSATGKYSPPRFTNYVTGAVSATPFPATVVIHEGEPATYLAADGTRKPIPGMEDLTYLQFAREGLALQKSQNGGASRGASAGAFDVGYARYASRIPNSPPTEQSLFDGIDTSLAGIASLAPDAKPELRAALEKIDQQIAEAQRLFDPAKPELTAPPLRVALGALDDLIRELEDPNVDDFSPEESYNLLHELRIKRVQANNALVLALGVSLSAQIDGPDHNAEPAQLPLLKTKVARPVRVTTRNLGKANLGVSTWGMESGLQETIRDEGARLDPGEAPSKRFDALYARNAPGTRPYFSRPNTEQPFYDISDPDLRDAPATPPPLIAFASLHYEDVHVELRETVPGPTPGGAGIVQQPAVIVPPVSITLSRRAQILPSNTDTLMIEMAESPPKSDIDSKELGTPSRWRVEILPGSTDASMGGLTEFKITVPPSGRKSATLRASVKLKDGTIYSEGFRPVGYPGLVYTNYYTPATVRIVPVDLHTAPGLRVAYLPGTGDDLPAYLPDLGVTPTILTVADLTAAKLAQYDAVVLGVRAYAAHPELAGAGSQPLLDYAKNGGVVIVQYNTARYGDADAPFPIAVPGSPDLNVVEEEQPVTLLAPDSPILTWPNRITPADFDHWIEERGHGFARSWSPEYTPLLEMHDEGQDPQRGGLLVARTGSGFYVYCALALYRQLPEGVPGAYRLFANLLSIAKNPALLTPTTAPPN
jgi:LmbE family N-acetylglucosaminyl deacetylase